MNKNLAIISVCAIMFVSCSNSDDGGQNNPISKQIAGLIEKGPFVQGSEVTLKDLNEDLSQSGKSFSTNTSNDLGSFDFGQTLSLSSGIVELKTSGYFYNECTGKLSSSQITLKAIANANETKNLNVNLLTHLEYDRVKYLVKNGTSFQTAKKQAEQEILKTFAITDKMSSPEKVSLTDNNKDASILLAISSIMLYEKSEAEFSEFIAKFSSDLEKDGTIDNSTIKETIKEGQKNCHPATIIQAMKDFYQGKGSDVTINDFSSYVDFNGDGVIDDKDQEEKPTDQYYDYDIGEGAVIAVTNAIYANVLEYVKLQNELDVMRLNNNNLQQLTPDYSVVEKLWNYGYKSISYALKIIQNLQNADTPYNKEPYLSSANALRAFVMYNMATQWGNLPIVSQISVDANLYNSPSSTEEQYKFALSLLDNLYINPRQPNYYFTQKAVNILKAEIYLALGMKDKAKSVLDEVSDEDVFILRNEQEKNDIEIYSTEYIAYLKDEASGVDNSSKWYTNRKDYYGTFAALKRLGKIQSLTGIDSHYNLLPIPSNELYKYSNWSQNQGY